MALTNKQVEGVCNLFANAFVNTKSEEGRKKVFIDFEDAFSKGITDWKTICAGLIKELTTDANIIDLYNNLSKEKKLDRNRIVILAHTQPELVAPFVYINSFAVAKHARGNGIGKALFMQVKKHAHEESIFMLKLQTDPKIEAYEIYKHWGMQESELVMMKGYCI